MPASYSYQLGADLQRDGYRDLAGVIHVHTRYSDGSGTFEEVAAVANQQGLDFLVTTDHNTLKPLHENKQGWYGQTLVLAGTEISTSAGHYLALNITQEIDRRRLSPQQIIDAVNAQGGLGFIAHPYGRKRWKDWSLSGYTGIEIYNAAHDALEESRLRMLLWAIAAPQDPFFLELLDRPYDPLTSFDVMIARHGPLVGIGSADAHQQRWGGVRFAPYSVLFRLVRTHVLVPDAPITPSAIYDALRQGHAYASFELIDSARGFSWSAKEGDSVLGVMGDSLPFKNGLMLQAWLPAPANLTLFKDGQVMAYHTGTEWTIEADGPGAYRLEASRHGKPWVLSNPIYLK
jgi:hypothetical protein